MPLEILLGLVVAGIAGIAALTWWLGYGARKTLSADTARTDWLRHFPDDRVSSIWIGDDAHTALVLTDGGLGLLWSLGADTVARPLAGAQVIDTETGLAISFPDVTAPRVDVRLRPEARLVWKRLMEAA